MIHASFHPHHLHPLLKHDYSISTYQLDTNCTNWIWRPEVLMTLSQSTSCLVLLSMLCLVHTRRPASADRTAHAANFRRDL